MSILNLNCLPSCVLIFSPSSLLNATFHLKLPIISALCYFPGLCKWHELADLNSHSTEEMSQSLRVPSSDGSSITKAANTHYTPCTDHHSNNCNSRQCCRKLHSGVLAFSVSHFTHIFYWRQNETANKSLGTSHLQILAQMQKIKKINQGLNIKMLLVTNFIFSIVNVKCLIGLWLSFDIFPRYSVRKKQTQ